MKAETEMLDADGNWIEAVEEPYYPNIVERIKHRFGHHIFVFSHLNQICDQWWVGTERVDRCLICDKRRYNTFNSSHPLTKEETENRKPSLTKIDD